MNPQLFSHQQAETIWAKLAAKNPLIHCLTNSVAKNFSANALLAVGASPAMVEAEEESAIFAAVAANLLINIGTINAMKLKSMRAAAKVAQQHKKPWVLDPVAVGEILTFRSHFTRELLHYRPAVIRGNAAEILWLAGEKAEQKGADSLSSSEDEKTLNAAVKLAQRQHCVVVITGEKDFITDGETLFYTTGGDLRMTKVTATGCVLSALTAAFCTVAPPLEGAAAAATVMKMAGDFAANHSTGLGSFAVALLDGLTFQEK